MNCNRSFLPSLFFLTSVYIFAFAGPSFAGDLLRVHFIGVGYGDAIVVQLPGGKTMMVDAGEMPFTDKVVNYLQSLALNKIDWAVITHPHNNHFGGYFGILRAFEVGEFLINGDPNGEEGYDDLLALAKNKNIPIRVVKRGMDIGPASGDVHVRVLHPPSIKGPANGNSLVLWLTYKEFSLLLTGDLLPDGQDELMNVYPQLQSVDYVQLPHHAWPFHERFPSFFKGKTFFASTGTNQWGIPDEQQLSLLDGPLFRTDQQGTIVVTTDGDRAWVKPLGGSGK